MCKYCMIADHTSKYPPWPNTPTMPYQYTPTMPYYPNIPQPVVDPTTTLLWKIELLKEYLGLLKQVKEMEDKLGCPCEPNKADYIGRFAKRIEDLSKE